MVGWGRMGWGTGMREMEEYALSGCIIITLSRIYSARTYE